MTTAMIARWWDAETATFQGQGMSDGDLAAAAGIMTANPGVTATILDRDHPHLDGKSGHYVRSRNAILVGGGFCGLRALAHEVFHSVGANLPDTEYDHLLAVCAMRLPATDDIQRTWFGYAAEADPVETAAHLYADWLLDMTTAGFRPDDRIEELFLRVRAGEFAGPSGRLWRP
jgi:hypothetical protein